MKHVFIRASDELIIQYLPEQHAHYLEDVCFKSKIAFLHTNTNLRPVFLAVVRYTVVYQQTLYISAKINCITLKMAITHKCLELI